MSNTVGSATSSATFLITSAATGAPTITGFAPTIVAQGATLTVNGTNFDPILSNNRLSLSATFAAVATASAGSVTTIVPGTASSGPITIATPNGTATSAADLFVAPAPHVAADVEVAERIAVGDTRTVTINTAGHIGLYTFSGTQGQRVSLLGTGISGFVLGCDVNVSILTPSGGYLGVAPSACMEVSGFIDTSATAGDRHAVYVEPVSPTVGNVLTFTG